MMVMFLSTCRFTFLPSFSRLIIRRNKITQGSVNYYPTLPPYKQEQTPKKPRNARLRVYGPDEKGIVAALSYLLNKFNCGVVNNKSESLKDGHENLFFQRIVFDHNSSKLSREGLETEIKDSCVQLGMNSMLDWGTPKRVAVMVSKYDHCLWEILLRHRAGELDCEIVTILSNHPDHKPIATMFGIPYHVFEINSGNKQQQEKLELHLLKNVYKVDLVILARYMQVFSDSFVNSMPFKIINIHHSFLPAFKGSKPYHRAHERGVKLIGATAHYATPELDEGPIIEQDLIRITHRDSVQDLIQKGRTLEKNVLVHAIKIHLEDRTIVYKHKCIVFSD